MADVALLHQNIKNMRIGFLREEYGVVIVDANCAKNVDPLTIYKEMLKEGNMHTYILCKSYQPEPALST